MIYKVLAAGCALIVGGWMLIDGVHCLLRGKYIGPEKPGPWSNLFTAAGINPFRLAPMFIVFGIAWLGSQVFLRCAPPSLATRAWWTALVVAIATLWYLPIGTVISIVYIVVLVLGRAAFR